LLTPADQFEILYLAGDPVTALFEFEAVFGDPASPIPNPRISTAVLNPDARAWLKELLSATELVAITERIAACRDPTDDKFHELAVNGHADLIVSGDRDLLALNPFRQIPIVTPAAFVQGAPR